MSRLLSEEAAAPTLASLAADIAATKADLSATKGSVDTFYFITVGALDSSRAEQSEVAKQVSKLLRAEAAKAG